MTPRAMRNTIHTFGLNDLKKHILLKTGLVALLLIAPALAGCERLSEEPAPVTMPDSRGRPATAPPPIAPGIEAAPHGGLPEELREQSRAGEIMRQINLYKERLEADPQDLEALIALGNANFDIQRFDKAKDLYLRALKIDPKNVSVRTDLASCYRNLGDINQAFAELERVLAIDAGHETALYNKGVLLLNDRNDTRGAIRAWEKLIEKNPDLEYAQDLREKIEALKHPSAPAGAEE